MSSLPDLIPWTKNQFFAWQLEQDERYELVGGFPLRMMTGASNRHDRIVVNIIAELRFRLRGGPCRPMTADGSLETFPGQIRRPDAGIDCGPFDPDGFDAKNCTAVFEVLSPTTRDFDRIRKLEEYKAVSSMRDIVVVEPTFPGVIHTFRDEEHEPWRVDVVTDPAMVLALRGASIELPVAEIYAGVETGDGPKRE